jgi:hypothetical protein
MGVCRLEKRFCKCRQRTHIGSRWMGTTWVTCVLKRPKRQVVSVETEKCSELKDP